jgi:hypothetical protein
MDPTQEPEEKSFEKPVCFKENKEGRIIFVPPNNSRDRPYLDPWAHSEFLNLFKPYKMP